ncbi:MAG: hypothetical protein CMP47_09470 [Rickettsiales bacterium]|nr:hypothetical protein [Rickettsiales bacterium]
MGAKDTCSNLLLTAAENMFCEGLQHKTDRFELKTSSKALILGDEKDFLIDIFRRTNHGTRLTRDCIEVHGTFQIHRKCLYSCHCRGFTISLSRRSLRLAKPMLDSPLQRTDDTIWVLERTKTMKDQSLYQPPEDHPEDDERYPFASLQEPALLIHKRPFFFPIITS